MAKSTLSPALTSRLLATNVNVGEAESGFLAGSLGLDFSQAATDVKISQMIPLTTVGVAVEVGVGVGVAVDGVGVGEDVVGVGVGEDVVGVGVGEDVVGVGVGDSEPPPAVTVTDSEIGVVTGVFAGLTAAVPDV
jgi:hypothetical protein